MFLGLVVVISVLFGTAQIRRLDRIVQEKFDGKRWALPATVYARPLELFVGKSLSLDALEQELGLADYRNQPQSETSGWYRRKDGNLRLKSRDFHFADGFQQGQEVTVSFIDGRISSLVLSSDLTPLSLVRVDPARIGSFLPGNNEDRIVLERSDLPDSFVRALLAIEDRKFYSHNGIDLKGILRALFSNLRAGQTVQGGSTLTQQLVKNFYLTSERTLRRKVNEAVMALLLERRYDKDEILTAYVNEIFLGQDGRRAVHGFGLAGRFYFGRDLDELNLAQTALLVGMIKGPSLYNPRRFEERCLRRRQVILDRLLAEGEINSESHSRAQIEPLLDDSRVLTGGFNRFPAFLDLVQRNLHVYYHHEDLTSNGLKIFTTLSPRIQFEVEKQLQLSIGEVEEKKGENGLEGAAIITDRSHGDILALAGSRHPLEGTFNRALDARRPVGSLIKPAVYLTGLVNGYTLASPLRDQRIGVKDGSGTTWRPHNYDNREHGRVMLYRALARSYNLATVRLGLKLGIEKVLATVQALGIEEDYPDYPSFFLGTAEMTPLQVATMYQTLATGGFYTPLKGIYAVMDKDNRLLQTSEMAVEQRFAAGPVFLLNHALQRVMTEGTGRSMKKYLPRTHAVAGKTGTSNDLRDSWFAGFTGSMLGVVWVGRDDNRPAGITGATAALPVWGKIMRAVEADPLALTEPASIKWSNISKKNFRRTWRASSTSTRLPFVKKSSGSGFRWTGGIKRKSAQQQSRPDDEKTGLDELLDSFLDIFRQ